MHDLQTMAALNAAAEKRELDTRNIRFTHPEVEYLREWFATVSNPTPLLRGIIRKFEMIHELQLEAHLKNVARFKERGDK